MEIYSVTLKHLGLDLVTPTVTYLVMLIQIRSVIHSVILMEIYSETSRRIHSVTLTEIMKHWAIS